MRTYANTRPTPKQLKYLAYLSRENDYTSAGAAARAYGLTWDGLTFAQASALIDSLKNGRRPGTQPLAAVLQRTVERYNQRHQDNQEAYKAEQERQGTSGPISLTALAARLNGENDQNQAPQVENDQNRPTERPQERRTEPAEGRDMQEKPPTLAELRNRAGGFITEKDLPHVIAENRLYPCLVRCGGGRFVCPAQDVQHFIDIIEADGRDYVRDVCLNHSNSPAR